VFHGNGSELIVAIVLQPEFSRVFHPSTHIIDFARWRTALGALVARDRDTI
jgi:hypothetical protein